MFPNSESPCGIKIIQGGEMTFFVRLINKQTGDPFDLTGATAITTCFYNTDGTELNLSLGSGISIVSPAPIGKLQISLSAAQTALLDVISDQILEISVEFGGDPTKIQIFNAYSVLESVC